ncbi:uncharacterized protein FTJAE_3059 [Fusarium tjaetaba]|uniref:Uncharacterized protein n=1 Tax=Fusarium tjaetaba TaxID=1567544 RepID=A0A8H5W332_9HYPO|nr:uncharacterized protein FTJAE_3059 [Fusarium tjaetaba]KAF5643760.1 hypothetical protein FTJAE_3059 [Fusarium tjaetaba]
MPRKTTGQQQSQQSGAGHGNMGRDKNQDLTSIGPSLASKHGIQKRESDSGMSIVDSMQRRNSNAEIGLVNTSHGRGPQNRMVTGVLTNELEARTDEPDGNQIITTPQAPLDTRQVAKTAEAAPPDRIAEAERRIAEARRRNQRIEAYSSLGKPRRSRGTRTRGDPLPRVTEVDSVAAILCAGCGSNTHTLKGCITTISGDIRGCVFCNNMSHATDACGQFMDLSMGQRVKLLVTDRAGMPPILTEVPWWVWLYKFLTTPHTKGQPIPDAFPWRTEFARDIHDGKRGSKSVQEYQSDLDRSHDIRVLPPDERIQIMDDVFSNFWDVEGRVWPARLNELPSLTEANAETTTSAHGNINVDAPATAEVERYRDTIVRLSMELCEKDKEIESLKKRLA